jgi:hypothetical protein
MPIGDVATGRARRISGPAAMFSCETRIVGNVLRRDVRIKHGSLDFPGALDL